MLFAHITFNIWNNLLRLCSHWQFVFLLHRKHWNFSCEFCLHFYSKRTHSTIIIFLNNFALSKVKYTSWLKNRICFHFCTHWEASQVGNVSFSLLQNCWLVFFVHCNSWLILQSIYLHCVAIELFFFILSDSLVAKWNNENVELENTKRKKKYENSHNWIFLFFCLSVWHVHRYFFSIVHTFFIVVTYMYG